MNEGSSERNWASNLNADAMREASMRSQAALQIPLIHPRPAPIGHKNGNSDPPEKRIELVADAAVAKVLAAQAQAAEAIDSSDGCEVVTSLYFAHEPGGPPASAHCDTDPQYCRGLRVALNVANRVVNAYVSKGEMHSVKYLCGKAIARLVLRQQQTSFEAAVLALLLTMISRAPNARISEDQLAVGLTRSPLLARLPELLSNGQLVPGRSFSLSRFKVFTPKQNLGNPWNRLEGRR
jgi:hypothetical protein